MNVCQVCKQPWQWHQEHKPRHQYVPEGEEPRLGEPAPPTPPPNSLRGDPVLRLALVKAGVILDADIHEAEVWVREAASSGQAVVVDSGEFKVVSIEEWIKVLAR